MIAGDLSIRISAELAQFEKDMATTVARAGRSGGEAGSRYASEFAKFGETMKNRLQSQLAGVSKNVLNPLAIASSVSQGFTTALKTGNVAQAYVDFVTSLPIVGTFADQLIGIYDVLTGELANQAEREAAVRQEAVRVRRENKRIGEEREIARIAEQKAKEVEDLRRSMADTTAELNSAYAKRAGDEEKAIAFQIDREDERLRQHQAEAEKGATDEQKRQIQEVFRLRRRLNMEEGEQRINEIAKRRREEEEEAKEAAARAQEIEQNRLQKEAEDREKMLEDLKRKETELEEERIAAQSAGVGEAQTALGAFKFDAYPATQKKANDERIVKALEDIRTQQRQTAGGFA